MRSTLAFRFGNYFLVLPAVFDRKKAKPKFLFLERTNIKKKFFRNPA
tara:strand:+ start:491 stop:631 length:141 start_codon:yes stop_codon:yes gene_type:complete